MRYYTSLVDTFNHVFKIKTPRQVPCLTDKKDYILRYDLGKEELDEYLEACKENDLVEIADSLGDQLYILCGTILKHGMADIIQPVFEEIHRSNMSKLDEQGLPIFREDGKIIKSNEYIKPDFSKIL